MHLKKFVVTLSLVLLCQAASADDAVTIVTYYPAPHGEYEFLSSQGETRLALRPGSKFAVGKVSSIPGVKAEIAEGPLGLSGSEPWTSAGWEVVIKTPEGKNFALAGPLDIAGALGFGITSDVPGSPGGEENAGWYFIRTGSAAGNVAHPPIYPFLVKGGAPHLSLFVGENGNVGIGVVPAERLHVAGNALAAAFITPSDARFKTDIRPLTGVLEKLKDLQPVSFAWKEEYRSQIHATSRREIGLIGQEVERIFPELVTKPNNDTRAIDYGRLGAVLLEAVKEQQEEIEALKKEVDALKDARR